MRALHVKPGNAVQFHTGRVEGGEVMVWHTTTSFKDSVQ